MSTGSAAAQAPRSMLLRQFGSSHATWQRRAATCSLLPPRRSITQRQRPLLRPCASTQDKIGQTVADLDAILGIEEKKEEEEQVRGSQGQSPSTCSPPILATPSCATRPPASVRAKSSVPALHPPVPCAALGSPAAAAAAAGQGRRVGLSRCSRHTGRGGGQARGSPGRP